MKAIRSHTKITPFGGAVPILKKIKEFGIPQVIRSTLGVRKKQSRYGYEDVFIAWVLTALCGGTRLDHITKLKKKLNIIPGLKLPSHDTLGRVMKKLASEIELKEIPTQRAVTKNFCHEPKQLNEMLVKVSKRIGILKENKAYTLDIDATFISTNCAGANLSQKESLTGFNPMICLIGDLPVYISMRNGNTNSEFQITDCLRNCLDLLAANKIRIGKVISDGAGYNQSLIDMLHERGIKFNIHAPVNPTYKKLWNGIEKHSQWKDSVIESANSFRKCELTEVLYGMHGSKYEHRIIVARVPCNEYLEETDSTEESINRMEIKRKMKVLEANQKLKPKNRAYELGEWKSYKKHRYKLIITNDFKKSAEELLIEYNKRGNAERKFSFLKNDFGWKWPPFMNMNENTVFMIASSLANNLFRGMAALFKKKIPEIRLNARIREFQFMFINVACAYVDKTYIFYNTDIEYEKIMSG